MQSLSSPESHSASDSSSKVKKYKTVFQASPTASFQFDLAHWNALRQEINREFAKDVLFLEEVTIRPDHLCFFVRGLTPDQVEQDPTNESCLKRLNLALISKGFSALKRGERVYQRRGEQSSDLHPVFLVLVTDALELQRRDRIGGSVAVKKQLIRLFFFAAVAALLFYYLFYQQLAHERKPWKKIWWILTNIVHQHILTY